MTRFLTNANPQLYHLAVALWEARLGQHLGQEEATHWHPCLSQHVLELEAKMDQLRTMVEAADREKVELLNQLEEEKRWSQNRLSFLKHLRESFPIHSLAGVKPLEPHDWLCVQWRWDSPYCVRRVCFDLAFLRSLEPDRCALMNWVAVYWALTVHQTSSRRWPEPVHSTPGPTWAIPQEGIFFFWAQLPGIYETLSKYLMKLCVLGSGVVTEGSWPRETHCLYRKTELSVRELSRAG